MSNNEQGRRTREKAQVGKQMGVGRRRKTDGHWQLEYREAAMRKGAIGCPHAVAQVSDLPCRGFPIRRSLADETWFFVRGQCPAGSRRYSPRFTWRGLETCATPAHRFDPTQSDPIRLHPGWDAWNKTMAYKIVILYLMILRPSPVGGKSSAGAKGRAKRTQMLAAFRAGKHRFSMGIQTFRPVLGSGVKPFFTKRTQMKKDAGLLQQTAKPRVI